MTKNADKMNEANKYLEDKELLGIVQDVLALNIIQGMAEEINDRKLSDKICYFLAQVREEFGNRDYEEEKKKEFFCHSCHEFKPIGELGEFGDCKACNNDNDEKDVDDYDDD